MPTVTPDSPGEFSPFNSDYEHVRAHRALETAIESIDSSGTSTTGTTSTATLLATTGIIGTLSATTVTISTLTAVTGTVSGQLTANTVSTLALIVGSTLTGTGATALLNTNSVVNLIATRVGFGGATPTTNSTAAPILGFFRTAGQVGYRIPAFSASTCSVQSVDIPLAPQIGNPIQVGDPVVVIPMAALPANVLLGNAYVIDTNSIRVLFHSASGAPGSATASVHVFTVDLT